MIVLGLDPGTSATGYGVVEQRGGRLAALDYGVIATPAAGGGKAAAGRSAGTAAEPARLASLHRAVADVIHRHRPDLVAIEEVFVNRNPRAALAVGQARGVTLLAAAQAGVPVTQYAASMVKLAVAGYGAADKGQVQAMVRAQLGLAGVPRPDHAADALAVAICALGRRRADALAGEMP